MTDPSSGDAVTIAPKTALIEAVIVLVVAQLLFAAYNAVGELVIPTSEGDALSVFDIVTFFAAMFSLIGISLWVMNYFMGRHGDSWRAFGVEKKPWKNTALVFGVVILGHVALSAVVLFVQAEFGEEADLSRFNPIEGNLVLLLGALVSIWVTAGVAEEIIFRGFVLNRLGAVFAGRKNPWVWAVAIQAVIFGLMHLYQGPVGIVATGLSGVLMGTVYVMVGRNLVAIILAHGAWDTAAMVAIYLGLV